MTTRETNQPAKYKYQREFICPICKDQSIHDDLNFEHFRCSSCQATERHRLLWLAIENKINFKKKTKILFIGGNDNRYLINKLSETENIHCEAILVQDGLCVEKSKSITQITIDEFMEIKESSYDVVIHSHFAQQVKIKLRDFLCKIHEILTPAGHHLFTTPTRNYALDDENYEDLNEKMSYEKFGHKTWVRVIGRKELLSDLINIFGNNSGGFNPLASIGRDKLREAAITYKSWQNTTNSSVYYSEKSCTSNDIIIQEQNNVSDIQQKEQTQTNTRDIKLKPDFSPLQLLIRDNPWPDFSHIKQKPFILAIDNCGNAGREIIIAQIQKHNIELMLEIGIFLGGSCIHWLESCNDLKVIGLDPLEASWAKYVKNMMTHPIMAGHAEHLSTDDLNTIIYSLYNHGNYLVALNNLKSFKNRFIPVRRYSPDGLFYLKRIGINPELIYIDANKKREDIDVAFKLFPKAIICGDDWLWPDPKTGKLVMQDAVNSFAKIHGFDVESKLQTWVIHK